MGKVMWLLAGLLLGAVGAHFLVRTERGRVAIEAAGSRANEFANTVAESYRARQAELNGS